LAAATARATVAICAPDRTSSRCLISAGVNVHLVAATSAEIARAKRHPATEGAEILASVMQHYHLGFDLDRTRDCLTKRRDFSRTWSAVEAEGYEWPIGP
jgi:hypothetical protein